MYQSATATVVIRQAVAMSTLVLPAWRKDAITSSRYGGAKCVATSCSLVLHEFLHAPVLDLDHVNRAGAVHADAVRKIELAGNLAVRTQHAQNLAVQVQLHHAIVQAVAHI